MAVMPAERRRSLVSDLGDSVNLSLSQTLPKDPLFVVPPGFHPNASFVGMKAHLEQLHTRLYKAKKRAERLVAVLICGGPGTGKSHLARQYVWTHRAFYPGGVFWVDAKSRQSTFKCFWDIAQAATLNEGQDFEYPDTDTSQKYVDSVRNWLQAREEWLLVFDGISFGQDSDLNNFKQFLPFNKKCSIIYTSVDKTLRKKQRLYEPFCLSVKPLEVTEACKLLFEDLGIRKPTKEQIRKATALVEHYECLPLAIHAISHRLAATSKPIERYHVNSHLTDEKLAEPFLSIMHDLYRTEHFEALNLINLVSFFSHHVPVGLITLGISALSRWNVDILTSSRHGERGDIDTTLGVLIRYGLIERVSDAYALHAKALSPQLEKDNVLDMKSVAPDLSESQTESSQDAFFSVYQNSGRGTIDMIKTHSVVQGFCRDELKIMDREEKRCNAQAGKSEAGFYDSWLVVATHVLCTSYESAKARMDRIDDCGLVKDYREYETHAFRLIENWPRKTSNEPAVLREARDDLKRVMKSITSEIDRISPSSSQESVRKQRSVFDRSSSSSSSVPESAAEEGRWDWSDMTPPKVESPQEMPVSHQRFNLKPFLPHIFRESSLDRDGGYESDRESTNAPIRTSPALSQLSQQAETPKSSLTSSSSPPIDDHGWHMVVKKHSKPKIRKDSVQRPRFPRNIKGSQPAAPVLKIFPVEGRSASSSTLGKSRRSSYASASDALTAVQHSSPPHSHEDITKITKRVTNRSSLDKENTPTYATVAARHTQDGALPSKQRSSSTPGDNSRPALLSLQNKSSGESLQSRSSNAHPSPLSAEFKPDRMTQSTYSEPDQGYLQHRLNALDLGIAQESQYRTRHLSTVRPIAPPVGDMSASTPSVLTYIPPPPPLPYEGNIEVTVPRRVGVAQPSSMGPSPGGTRPVAHPSAFMPGISPPSSLAADPLAGYSSEPAPEPMSRNQSAQSQQSWSTEPIRHPPRFSPLPATTPAQSALASGVPHVVPPQHTVSGAGSWVADVPQQVQPPPGLGPRQPEVGYAAKAPIRPINTLDGHVAAIDPIWAAEPASTLQFGAHRVDVRDARQRLGGRVHYPAHLSSAIPGYPMYHPNLSGPLIPHDLAIPVAEPHGLRVRSGSSPPRADFDGFSMSQ